MIDDSSQKLDSKKEIISDSFLCKRKTIENKLDEMKKDKLDLNYDPIEIIYNRNKEHNQQFENERAAFKFINEFCDFKAMNNREYEEIEDFKNNKNLYEDNIHKIQIDKNFDTMENHLNKCKQKLINIDYEDSYHDKLNENEIMDFESKKDDLKFKKIKKNIKKRKLAKD
jgi:hypothetical protein